MQAQRCDKPSETLSSKSDLAHLYLAQMENLPEDEYQRLLIRQLEARRLDGKAAKEAMATSTVRAFAQKASPDQLQVGCRRQY